MWNIFVTNIRICIYVNPDRIYFIVNNENCILKAPYVNKLTTGCGHPWCEREELKNRFLKSLPHSAFANDLLQGKDNCQGVCTPFFESFRYHYFNRIL
jgi:hypothetical protein